MEQENVQGAKRNTEKQMLYFIIAKLWMLACALLCRNPDSLLQREGEFSLNKKMQIPSQLNQDAPAWPEQCHKTT